MNQPNLFTVVLRHPECAAVAVCNVSTKDVAGIILRANPVKTAEVYLAQEFHQRAKTQQIQDQASCCVAAYSRPGGFDVEFVGPGEAPKWAEQIVDDLDWTKRQQRIERRRVVEQQRAALAAQAEAQRVAKLAANAHKDTARRADAARERLRGVLPKHAKHDPMFMLDARVRLVGA